jgi:hypothetical protein
VLLAERGARRLSGSPDPGQTGLHPPGSAKPSHENGVRADSNRAAGTTLGAALSQGEARRRRGGYALHHATHEGGPVHHLNRRLDAAMLFAREWAPTSTTPEVPRPAQHRKARARTTCARKRRARARRAGATALGWNVPPPAIVRNWPAKRERDLIAACAIADRDRPLTSAASKFRRGVSAGATPGVVGPARRARRTARVPAGRRASAAAECSCGTKGRSSRLPVSSDDCAHPR